MRIYFAGNKKVYAEFNDFTVQTDQPIEGGGDATAPAPYDLFLASLGTCAGIYVKGFCDSRGLSAEGIEIIQDIEYDFINRKVGKITLDIRVPSSFPEKYLPALIAAANHCAVKKTIQDPPEFDVQTTVVEQ